MQRVQRVQRVHCTYGRAQRVQRIGLGAHLQMLEAGTLGGRTRVGTDDSLHEVPEQQQAGGYQGRLSGQTIRADIRVLGGSPRGPLAGAARASHGGRVRGAGEGGHRT